MTRRSFIPLMTMLLAASLPSSATVEEKREFVRDWTQSERARGRFKETPGVGRMGTVYKKKTPKTPEDFEALARAQAKRDRRAAKRIAEGRQS